MCSLLIQMETLSYGDLHHVVYKLQGLKALTSPFCVMADCVLQAVLFINVPSYFPMIWRLIKPAFNEVRRGFFVLLNPRPPDTEPLARGTRLGLADKALVVYRLFASACTSRRRQTLSSSCPGSWIRKTSQPSTVASFSAKEASMPTGGTATAEKK